MQPQYKNILVIFLFGGLSLVGMFHHEPWRDEIQAWLITIHSHSIIDLFENCKYEGHPLLWYLILFLPSRFSNDIIWMQLTSVLFATLSVWLLLKYCPLPFWQKVLFAFGYLPFYQYNLISRSYVLILLLSIVWLIWFTKNPTKLWGWFVLFLLANVSATGVVFSISFGSMYFLHQGSLQNFSNPFNLIKIKILPIFIWGLGVALAVWQIFPEVGNTWGGDFSPTRFIQAFASISSSYTWADSWSEIGIWNGVIFKKITLLTFVISAISFSAFTFLLSKNLPAFLLYTITSLLTALLLSSTMMLSARFIGHYFLILFFAYWLNHLSYLTFPILSKFSFKYERYILNLTMITLLVFQSIFGTASWIKDYQKPFSNTKAIANFIQANYSTFVITGLYDYQVSPFSYWLGKDIFFQETQQYGSYIIWNGKRKHKISPSVLLQSTDSLLHHHDTILVILSADAVNKTFQNLTFSSNSYKAINIQFVKKFDGALVKDENYYLYIATRK